MNHYRSSITRIAFTLAVAFAGPGRATAEAMPPARGGVPLASEIVDPLPLGRKAVYSTDHEPSAAALVETWLAGYGSPRDPKTDRDRYQILDRRVAWEKVGHAILVFRLLPAAGDALGLAASRCPGRKAPIDIQVYFEWSSYIRSWVPLLNRGDPGFGLCPDATSFWTAEQLAKLLDPPQLPVPPTVADKDVATPPPGSADREALLDAVRPLYERLFGKPIVFQVERLRVAAGFAFMSVHPERPGGRPIEASRWKRAIGDCEQTPQSVTHEYWMRQHGKTWVVGRKNQFCADDSIADEGDIIGAPPQLVGRDRWPERTTAPID